MSNNRSQSDSLESTFDAGSMSVSQKVHPEDIQPGDDVAVSEVMYQYPSYPWQSCGATLQPTDPVNVTFLPPADTEPMVVCSVCLPFVLCKPARLGTEFLTYDRYSLCGWTRRSPKHTAQREKKI